MRKVVYHVASTLDGFIADVDHGVAALSAEGEHVTEYLATLRTYDTIVMGRRTYEFGLRLGVMDPYPWARTIVFSRTLATGIAASPSQRVQVTGDDPVAMVSELRSGDGGPIYLCGGGELASTLFDAGLVDEVSVKLSPVLLGDGVPLSPGLGAPRRLRLRSTKVHLSGVVVLTYDVTGPPSRIGRASETDVRSRDRATDGA